MSKPTSNRRASWVFQSAQRRVTSSNLGLDIFARSPRQVRLLVDSFVFMDRVRHRCFRITLSPDTEEMHPWSCCRLNFSCPSICHPFACELRRFPTVKRGSPYSGLVWLPIGTNERCFILAAYENRNTDRRTKLGSEPESRSI